jgi:sugar phosphate isomerase/epimerase
MAAILILVGRACPAFNSALIYVSSIVKIIQPSLLAHPLHGMTSSPEFAGATMHDASRHTFPRRTFLQAATTASAALLASNLPLTSIARASTTQTGAQIPGQAARMQSAFRVAVISDEISQDFEHACSVIADEFTLNWVELRGLWGKNISTLDDADVAKANTILTKYKLRVTDIASPLFKVDWPGAPRSKYSTKADPKTLSYGADFAFKEQQTVLEKSIELAKQFKTERIRCFDFWRLDDQAPYRDAINAKLHEAAEFAGKHNMLLVLENEYECNTATGRESAKTLAAVQTPHLKLNWDPGNAVARGELDAFPAGFDLIPKDRIGHCHVKCAVSKPDKPSGFEWAAVGKGIPDWTAQFKALKQIGYKAAVSLETHWTGGGTPEESTRISWAGMKEALEKSKTAAPAAVPGDWPKVDMQG